MGDKRKPNEKRSKTQLAVGQTVSVLRDIQRREGLYAHKGEQGVVKDFLPLERDHAQYVQVEIDDKIKTFRTTSIAPIE